MGARETVNTVISDEYNKELMSFLKQEAGINENANLNIDLYTQEAPISKTMIPYALKRYEYVINQYLESSNADPQQLLEILGKEDDFKALNKYLTPIIDSKTGFPVDNEIASVTILSSSGTYADALSTALFVMGTEKAFSFWKEHRDFEMLIFTKDKRSFATEGLKNKVDFLDDSFEVYWKNYF